MSKVDLKTIFPSEINYNHFNPTLGICGETPQCVLDKNENIPRLKTLHFQNRKIGVLKIGGDIREIGFHNTNVDIRANKCDALAIWFDRDLSYPKDNYQSGDKNNFATTYPHIKDYFELPQMIQLFIMGIEQTLLRRVVAIGQEVIYSDIADFYKWIEIPKIRVKEPAKVENS